MIGRRLAKAPLRLVAILSSLIAAVADAAEPGQASAVPAGAIAIEAERGIEWQRNARIVIARGNATARRGDTTLRADVLTARYRDKPDGSVEVWRIDADGDVRVSSPERKAAGERGTYEIDAGKMSLSGGNRVTVTTPGAEITARQRIDYDIASKTLVARGDATVVEGERTLNGETITIRFAEDANGRTQPQRIEADGNMRLVTPGETITADHGTYDIAEQLATATGSVQILQGANRLKGCRVEMNLRTAVSRLSACAGDGARVRGVILPNTVKKD